MSEIIGSLENGKYYGAKYKEGFIYKNLEAYEAKEGVCYIPSIVMEELKDGVTLEEIKEAGYNAYTYNDLLELCKGNDKSVGFMLRSIYWVHPETFIDTLSDTDYEFCEKCGTIYDLEEHSDCPNCNKEGSV